MLKRPKRWLFLALLAIAVAGLFFLLRSAVGTPERTPDFISFYTAGEILRQGSTRHLYDLPLQHKIQRQFAPGGQFLPFIHPPFEAVLFPPLAHLTLSQAFMVWSALNLALLAIVFFLLPRTGYRLNGENLLAWIAAWLLPVAEAVAVGQDSIFLAMVFLLAFLALKKRRDFLAGLALGAGLYRFEIILPFVLIFLLRRRGKLLAGFFIAAAAAFLISVGLVGWAGLRDYLGVLITVGHTGGNETNGVILSLMPSLREALEILLHGILPTLDVFLIVAAGSLLLVAWSAWQFTSLSQPEDRAFDLQFCLAVIAALLASYHLYGHELTPLILVAFLALGYEQQARREGRLSVAKTVSLLVMCFLVVLVGGLEIHGVSLLFFILVGLGVWLSLEIAALRKSAAPRNTAAHAGLPDFP